MSDTHTKQVVVRFAPSPTGYLHIGSIRTALYDFLFAKHVGGKFILRVEDTDRKRFVADGERQLLDSLAWAGITFDEGPIRQSERLPVYKKYALELVNSGHAYFCFCTQEDLEKQRSDQERRGLAPRYNRTCRYLESSEVQNRLNSGDSYVIRLKVPETGTTSFTDVVRGEITVPNETIEDQVLMKSDGFPTYHLAVVVDDNEMGVTHILRGDEWIPSTPKHILLYQAFGWNNVPVYVHLPPVQRPDKTKKLGKRDGSTSVDLYRNEGYLPEALNNYLALQGWNPGNDKEIMTMDEMIALFDLNKLQKAGAAFNQDKLDWFNQQYILNLSQEAFEHCLDVFIATSPKVVSELPGLSALDKRSSEYVRFMKLALLERMRGVTLFEIAKNATEATWAGEYDVETLVWKKSNRETTEAMLVAMRSFIESIDDSVFSGDMSVSLTTIEETIKQHIATNHWNTGDVLWPLRVALSGKEKSPSPFELLWALGKAESLHRVDSAIHKFE